MSTFNLGLVGGGRMGQMHLRALSTSSQVAVTSVVDIANQLKLNAGLAG